MGAVATQSFVDPSYGPLGLALMKAGRSAPEALAALLAGDTGRDVRQVGMVDAKGNVATHTGRLDIPAAGGQSGSRLRRAGEPDGEADGVAGDGPRVRGARRATWPIACWRRSMPPRPRAATSAAASRRRSWS